MKVRRFKAFLIDYALISVYLLLLLLGNYVFNPSVFESGISDSQIDTQLIATFSSVLPIVLVFSWLEAFYGGTVGKQIMAIQVRFSSYRFRRSLLRNVLKFLPWQMGHVATIYAFYEGTDSRFIFLTVVNGVLLMVYLVGYIWVPPYIPDVLSGATFIYKNNNSLKNVSES